MVSEPDILNARILVVDDLEANVILLERTLRGAGYTSVASTMDSRDVCELHRQNRYDLILLDLEMPNMDGFQVMEGLKVIEADGYLPVLVLTAHPGHKLRALRAGAKDFLSKPFDLVEVLARANNMLEVRLLHTETRNYAERLKLALQEVTESRGLVQRLNVSLQEHVAALDVANEELESFSHSVSHDLRSPLRFTNKIAHLLLQEEGARLSDGAREKIDMILGSTQEMGRLIENLLAFSQVSREPMKKRRVDLVRLTREVIYELRDEQQGRIVEIVIDALPPCQADRALLKQVFLNLLANALKFTRPREKAEIRVGFLQPNEETVYFVRDNGVGFDMKHSGSVFQVFQRFHEKQEFEGSGIGLALVKRIIMRHGGRVWAEGLTDQGATFYFALGNQ